MNYDCWTWQGTQLPPYGYGQIRIGAARYFAHRLSWEINRGKIPKGMQINHHCDNPSCVNPDHLYVGTQADNMRDAARRLRHSGEKHHAHKLTDDGVRLIRILRQQDKTIVAIARQFGVSHQLIVQVLKGKIWKHVA